MTTSKRKGTNFERQLVKLLSEKLPDSHWKRVPGSGALGTVLKESSLSGDVIGVLRDDLGEFSFIVEAKYGYGGKNQITFRRSWVEQAKENANLRGKDFIPIIALRFKEARKNNTVICFEIGDFIDLLNRIMNLKDEFDIVVKDLEESLEKCDED